MVFIDSASMCTCAKCKLQRKFGHVKIWLAMLNGKVVCAESCACCCNPLCASLCIRVFRRCIYALQTNTVLHYLSAEKKMTMLSHIICEFDAHQNDLSMHPDNPLHDFVIANVSCIQTQNTRRG
jgi:hypothetical protein